MQNSYKSQTFVHSLPSGRDLTMEKILCKYLGSLHTSLLKSIGMGGKTRFGFEIGCVE